MNVREHLLALTDELRRLKGEGSRQIPVTEQTLAQLRRAVEHARTEVVALQAAAGDSEAAPRELSQPVAASPETVEPRAPTMVEPAEPKKKPRLAVTTVTAAPLPPGAQFVLPEGTKRERWEALREIVLKDETCLAHVYPGKKVVFGVGNIDASIMFIGEAPGADEEEQGEPFVGRAGQLLNRMIKAMGLAREDVYIGNILNWRPEMGTRSPDGYQTGNRPPTIEEMNYCLPFIRAQIAIIQPKVLVALGKTAVDGLLGPERFKTMGAARGAWHDYEGIPLRATYHPSYLLRQEGLTSPAAKKIKRDAWEDLLAVMERAGVPISEKQRNYFK